MRTPETAAELLQSLVRIPSVNPSGDPGTAEVGEAQLAEFLADHCRQLGAEVELREVLPQRPNMIARFSSDRPGKPRLLFAPHTDTVSVAGMTIDPFGGELHDGGSGAAAQVTPKDRWQRCCGRCANSDRRSRTSVTKSGLPD
jgi:acetylornithine deacetylase/succinyl-diaminopimelate desuccinylase-like protein